MHRRWGVRRRHPTPAGGGRRCWRLALVAGLIAAGPAPERAAAALPVQSDPLVEARLDSTLRASVDQIHDGRVDLAAQTVEDAARIAHDDPRIGLFRYRVLRVNYPDDVHEKERATELLPALLGVLDDSIAICDLMLAADPNSAAAYLYRGWAYMMQAQTYAIASKYWPAGSVSKKGKKDLDRFYELHPEGDPDAGAMLGGFLYFSDVLPGIVKFLKWIVRLPGGDKERGLELLNAAVEGDGYSSADAELVLAVIYYMFEGRVTEAAEMFERLARAHPWHPRSVEMWASTALLFPEVTFAAIEAESRLVDGWGERVRGLDDLFAHRLRWSKARLLQQAGLYEEALRELEAVIAHSPEHPFWITPRSLLAWIGLQVNLERREATRLHCQRLLSDDRYERYHEAARKLCAHDPSPDEVALFLELGPARQALYGGRVEEARQRLRRMIAAHGTDLRLRFLEGEVERLAGRHAEAAAAYGAVVSKSKDDGRGSLRLIALLRLGELHIERHEYQPATAVYKEARRIEPRATLIGNMIRGRLRYLAERQH